MKIYPYNSLYIIKLLFYICIYHRLKHLQTIDLSILPPFSKIHYYYQTLKFNALSKNSYFFTVATRLHRFKDFNNSSDPNANGVHLSAFTILRLPPLFIKSMMIYLLSD